MKKIKRYSKGFTLVEMITTITILGVVSLVALPVINSVSDEFTKRKFELYEETLISAGKLYVDQNGEDLFGDADDGCADVGFTEISEKNLIKDIELEDATCVSPNTYIRVKKKGSVYDYGVSITCMLKGQVAYEKTLEAASTCMPVGKESPDPSIDDPVPDVYIPTSTTITSEPKKSDTPSKSTSTTILISDEKGFAPNAKIQYYWINSSNHNALVGEKKSHNFKNALVKTSHTLRLSVSTPSGVTGNLKLVVEPINVVTGDGRTVTDKYTSDVFKVDNSAPSIVIKAYVYENDTKGAFVKQGNNADLTISDWKKHGYYFDFSGSSDNYGIVKQTWKWNKTNNVNMVTDYAGGSSTDNKVTDKTFTGHGARYGTVTMCDVAGNCTSKNIKVNISTVYTITYSKGDGQDGSTGDTTCYYGIDCKLASNGFTRTGHSFSKWKIGNNTYDAGGNVKSLSNQEGGSVTATAQWSVNSYKVTYHVNDSKNYNQNWRTEMVKYGEAIPTTFDVSPQQSIDEFRQFNGWNNVPNPNKMPAYDITLEASIGDQMCRVVTGHGSFYRVDAFRDVFANVGWSGATTEEFYWEGWYWRVVTQYNMTHAQADKALNDVWNNTSPSGDHALNYITLECANGYSYYLRRPWY